MNRYFYIVFLSILLVVLSVGYFIYSSSNKPQVKTPIVVNNLKGKTFVWVKSELNLNKETIVPINKDSYSVTFETNTQVKIGTDCNSGFGDYEILENKITFANITSTEKYCPDSMEGIFYNELISAESFELDSQGNLIINFKIGKIYLRELGLAEQVNGSVTNSLVGREFTWLRTELKNNQVILPKTQGKFVVTFSEDLKFSAKTDCNTNGGNYSLTENKITLTDLVATRMYCENSQEEIFIRDMQKIESYEILPDETLILNLPDNSGRIYFR